MFEDHISWKENCIENQKRRIENVCWSHKELFKLIVVPIESDVIVKDCKRQDDVIFNEQFFTKFPKVFT